MSSFSNIVIFLPSSWSDIFLATPLFSTLKAAYPGAIVSLWTDPELADLFISFCPSVDEVIDYDFEAKTKEHLKRVKTLKADLFIDLTISEEGEILARASGAKTLRYTPKSKNSHQVDDFLSVLRPLKIKPAEKLFPTFFPECLMQEIKPRLELNLGFGTRPLIGLAPGMDTSYPNRSWLTDGWEYLLDFIVSDVASHQPVLFGLPEDRDICAALSERHPRQVLNVSGLLNMTELATALFCADLLIACDSAAGHLAAAVGLPVIGLYGATSGFRRGPYGQENLLCDVHQFCECEGLPQCKYSGPSNTGKCMNNIALADICQKIQAAFSQDKT